MHAGWADIEHLEQVRAAHTAAAGDDTRQRSRLSAGCWAAGARVFSMLSRQMQHSTPCGMGLGFAGGFASAIENKPGTVLSMGLGCCRQGATRAGDGDHKDKPVTGRRTLAAGEGAMLGNA